MFQTHFGVVTVGGNVPGAGHRRARELLSPQENGPVDVRQRQPVSRFAGQVIVRCKNDFQLSWKNKF